MKWEELEMTCRSCSRCRLAQTRTNVVIGRGNRSSDIMLVGEGPGYNEDMQGIPFVGAAGQLLDKMLREAGLEQEGVYIANIVKCRPPQNRDPLADEQNACLNFLRHQYILIKPKILVCLGRIAAQAIIAPDFKITKMRGTWIERKGCHMIATYHPSALLRDENKIPDARRDMQEIKRVYDELRGK